MKIILLVTIALLISLTASAADKPFRSVADEGYDVTRSTGNFAPEPSTETSPLEQDTTLSPTPPQDVSETPLFKASTFSLSNKDRMLHIDNRLGLGVSRAGFIQWYGLDLIDWNDNADWLSFTSRKAFASVDIRPHSKIMLSNSLGQGRLLLNHFFGRQYNQTRDLVLWRSKIVFMPIPHTELRVEGSNDYSYVGWLERGQSQIMTMESVFAEVESFTIPRLQIKTMLKDAFLEDDNRQRNFENLVLYETLREPFNLKVGVSGGFTQFRSQMPDYWSPQHFENYGARAHLAHDWTQEWWSELKLYHGLHRDRYVDQTSLHKHETIAELSVQLRKQSGLLAKLLVNSFDTEDGLWWRNDIGLNLEVPF